MKQIQLKKKILFKGKITLLTGMHIGGTNTALSIGAPDKTVVRNPITNEPYIPGSSLKGKMRALFEINRGTINPNAKMGEVHNGPTQNIEHAAARLFGTAGDTQQPSRLIVRDAPLLSPAAEFSDTDLPFTESKTEVVIDRITSKANPRQIERVPAGAEFELNMVLNVFDGDNEKELIDNVFEAIRLLEDDYLGGNGSRGYGQVKVTVEKMTERSSNFYTGEEAEKEMDIS